MGNCCASPLRSAIRHNDVDKLTEILKEAGNGSADLIDNDVEADCCLDWMDCTRKPRSPLFTTVAKGNVEMTSLLLSYGADSSVFDHESNTLLHVTAYQNKLELFKLLYSHDKDLIRLANSDGMLPLHLVCCSKNSASTENIGVLEFIVKETDFGRDISNLTYLDRLGQDALSYARKHKNRCAVEFLNGITETVKTKN